jgi:hypothetical protein
MFITCTEYPLNMKSVKGYNGVTSSASGYGSARSTCQLQDGKTETIILQEVMHLLALFNLISQFQIMDNDIRVEPVNHYGLNLNNRHHKLIPTAPQVYGLFVLDGAPKTTAYTDLDDRCLLALSPSGHASQHDAEKWMLLYHHLAHVGLKALEILLKVISNAPKMTAKCDCKTCIKCELA